MTIQPNPQDALDSPINEEAMAAFPPEACTAMRQAKETQELAARKFPRPAEDVTIGQVARDLMDSAQRMLELHHTARKRERQMVDALRELVEALGELAAVEADYRQAHSIHTGRAWDRMRRAGDNAYALLASAGEG